MNEPQDGAPLNAAHFERRNNWLKRLLYPVTRLFIQDVPAANAQCEFACKRLECRYEEWADCKNRIAESRK